ncbi:MAG: UDP-N-acetylglucosamine 2-epimerase (non-hydrolyzing) [bacterium]|nr:UDP-N-acetylglucosamine 2-epimerase (non-hydrolyzing) [bacterium]
MTKLALIFGTRPEIIKMSPFIKGLEARERDFFIIHTGQHYSAQMDRVFWENFALPQAAYNLGVGSGTQGLQVGNMMIGIEAVLMKEKPDAVVVYADPNSAIAGALTAAKLNIPIIQLEGGLRSYDRTMPEEINRLVVDRLANYIFAPTKLQRAHLKKEGITKNVFVTGNLIADVVAEMLPRSERESVIHQTLGLEKGKYFLATVHRAGAVDDPKNFSNILAGLGQVAAHFKLPVIYPMHPRAKKNMAEFGLTVPRGVTLIEPAGYFDFLALLAHAKVILTDSGGLQEEGCILHVPVVSLRPNTERQETLALGSNMLSGYEPKSILQKTKLMAKKKPNWRHPYGKNVAKNMLDILEKNIGL